MQCCQGKSQLKCNCPNFSESYWSAGISIHVFFFFSFELSRPIYCVILCSYAGLLSDSCNPGQAAVIVSQMTPVFHTTIRELLGSAHSFHLSHLLLWPLEIPQWNSAIFGWRDVTGAASFVIYQHFPYQCSLNGIRLDRKEPILDAGNHPDLVIISFFTLVHVSVSQKISSFSNQRKKENIFSSFSSVPGLTVGYQPQQHAPTLASIIGFIWLKTAFAHFLCCSY